jgi:hypothetical protein
LHAGRPLEVERDVRRGGEEHRALERFDRA